MLSPRVRGEGVVGCPGNVNEKHEDPYKTGGLEGYRRRSNKSGEKTNREGRSLEVTVWSGEFIDFENLNQMNNGILLSRRSRP